MVRREVRNFAQIEIAPLAADLDDLLGRAPQAIGFGQFEGGADYYAYALRHSSTEGLAGVSRAAVRSGGNALELLDLILELASDNCDVVITDGRYCHVQRWQL